MSQTTPEIPKSNAPPTPVAKPHALKKWSIRTIAILLGALILWAILSSSHPSKSKPDNVLAPQTGVSAINAVVPHLTLTQQQMQKIEKVTNQLTENFHLSDRSQEEKLKKMRLVAPLEVYSSDDTPLTKGDEKNSSAVSTQSVLGGEGTGDTNTQFMSQVSEHSAPRVMATRMIHPSTTLAQGAIIWATLETRIVSDLPGMVRAVTSEDIYSEDGSYVLLPKGSRLIGQYTNAINQGQNRVFVVWQRIIRPDHIDVQLNSPGTDSLGAAGLEANAIDHHFFQQFGTAVLLSVIGAGAANVGTHPQDQLNSASAYREALADSFSQSAQNSWQSTGVIKPTLSINQGSSISVFVARDLDFYSSLNVVHDALHS